MLQGYFLGLATSPTVVGLITEKITEYGPGIKDFLVYFFRPYYVTFKALCATRRYEVKSLEETFGPFDGEQAAPTAQTAVPTVPPAPLPTYTDQPGFE